MTKPSNIPAIEKATRLSWDEWLSYLKDAKDLSHREIADLAYDKLKDKLDNAGWWSQSVAVAYEQHIGRRQPGQQSDGSFEATASKTVNGSMDETQQVWLNLINGQNEFDGVVIAGAPSTTQPKRGRHWAVNLADGSRLNADVYPKSDGKCSLTITHQKLANQADAERWRAYWKARLETIG